LDRGASGTDLLHAGVLDDKGHKLMGIGRDRSGKV
jgi:hypothetical protein